MTKLISIRDLQTSPVALLRRAYNATTTVAAQHLAPFNLTASQFGILVAAKEEPGVDATRIAQLLSFDRPTLTGVLDRLEQKKLLTREPHEVDRRARALYVTSAGERLLEEVAEAAWDIRNDALSKLAPEERKVLIRLLLKLID